MLAPCICTADSVDAKVDVQIDKASTLYFIRMTHADKILLTVVPGSDAEGLEAFDMELANLEPTDIAAVAIVLRMDILSFVILERRFVDANQGRTLTIGVILPGATAIVAYLGEVGRQAHPHAELGPCPP